MGEILNALFITYTEYFINCVRFLIRVLAHLPTLYTAHYIDRMIKILTDILPQDGLNAVVKLFAHAHRATFFSCFICH
jgi:hypothetical protein